MFPVYLFSLIVGGGLIVYSLTGGHDSHGGHDAGHGHDGHGHDAVKWLSFRTITYFLFVFGGIGAALSKTWPGGTWPLVLLFSIVGGLGVGAVVSYVFDFLRKTDSGNRDSEDTFVGLTGAVSLPIAAGGMGKVLVQRGTRTYELLAKPHDAAAGRNASKWKSVIIVEMSRGTALVTPLDDPAYKEIAALNQSPE